MRHLRFCSSALLLALAMGAPVHAGEADGPTSDIVEPSQEYLDARKALESMITSRDLDLYELSFEPISFERVVIPSGQAGPKAYHALVFRVMNRTVESADRFAATYKGFNQVLENITKEYDTAKLRSQDGSMQLRVDGADGPLKDGLIVERQESRARARRVRLTAEIATENISRLTILENLTDTAANLKWQAEVRALRIARRDGDLPAKPEARPEPHVQDPGELERDVPVNEIRRVLEEKHARRLFLPGELAGMELGAYDGTKRIQLENTPENITKPEYSMNGWYVGEAFGVFVFPDISEDARSITVRIDGLTNKMRRDAKVPEPQPGQKDDFFARRYLRRAYVLQYTRLGDAFYREQDPIVLRDQGWRWTPSFVRWQVREEISSARYILENIRVAGSAEQHDPKIATEQNDRYQSLKGGAQWLDAGELTEKQKETRTAMPELKPAAAP